VAAKLAAAEERDDGALAAAIGGELLVQFVGQCEVRKVVAAIVFPRRAEKQE